MRGSVHQPRRTGLARHGRNRLRASDARARVSDSRGHYLMRKKIFPAILSSGHWEGELRFRHCRTGQAIPMDYVGFLLKDLQSGEPRLVASISRDTTERRTLEQQLRHAQKFEAIGQLAGGIAHDFNNVIGAILGWAELGEEQAASRDAQFVSYFKKIHSQCD